MDMFKQVDEKIKKLNEKRLFEGENLQKIKNHFKIITTYSSNAIEGNTHTLEDVKVILEDKMTIGNRTLKEFYEIEGHGASYDYMFTLINKREITEDNILQCHRLFSQNIPDFISGGEYRKIEIILSASKKTVPNAGDITEKMKEYMDWLNNERDNLHPIMFAAEANRKLSNIFPFTDGNNRISRLVMNTCLYQDKYLPVSVPVLNKTNYYKAINKKQNKDFGNYIAELELQAIEEIMNILHAEQVQ